MSFWQRITAPFRSSSASTAIVAGYLADPLTPPPPATPAPAAPPPERRVVIEMVTKASWQDTAETLAGYKLTPERLFQHFRQADAGLPAMMFDAFEAIKLNDGHLRGQYEQRMDEVTLQDWHFFAPEEDQRPLSKEVALQLDAAMREVDTWSAIEHLDTGPFYGCAFVEVAWRRRLSDGLEVPVELLCPPHRRFRFDEESSHPRLMHEANMYPGEPLATTATTSWLSFVTRRWRKPSQAGLLRTCAPWAVFKRMSVRELLIFAEKFGIPMIIGKTGENSSETARNALVKALEILGTEGRAVLDNEAIVEIASNHVRSGQNDIHPTITALCNAEISKVLSGGTLTSDAQGPGSYGLGTVHASQKHALALADARRLTRSMHPLAAEFVRRNGWTGKAGVPRLHIEVEQDQLIAAQTLKTLGEAGLKLSARRQRRKFNQPEPVDAGDEMKPPTKSANAPNSKTPDPSV